MIAFGHTAVGASVGLLGYHLFQNLPPAEALVLTGAMGVASHYLADLVPHGHFFKLKDFSKKIYTAMIFDFILSVLVFGALAFITSGLSLRFWCVLFGIGGAQLPDMTDTLIKLKFIPDNKFFKWEHNFHMNTHWHGKRVGDEIEGLMWSKSDVWQVMVVLLSIFLIIR